MGCPVCKRLERTFEGWNSECIRARSSLYCSVSTRFAAYDNVEMERARSELQMHRSVCIFVDPTPAALRPSLCDACLYGHPDSGRRSASIRLSKYRGLSRGRRKNHCSNASRDFQSQRL